MRRLLFMVWKELLELRQDPRMLPIVFVAPVLQLVILGYAATIDVRDVPMVVVDEDRTPASRQLVDQFNADQRVRKKLEPRRKAQRKLRPPHRKRN